MARFRLGYPVIAILGPRQSGKSTLAQAAAPDLPFVNFEDPLERASFLADPRGFFAQHAQGAIIDEAQHVPELFPTLQARVDADRQMGRWILTGSQQLEMTRGISQSMAGRVAILELLPFSYAETATSRHRPLDLPQAVLRGGYAPLYDENRQLDPVAWLDNHLQALINRDLRDLLSVRDRVAFTRFVSLCAAHTGLQINFAEIAATIGVTQPTVMTWVSVLETAFIIRLLRPYERNFGKRIVKRPKLYFIDTGLACRLLHIADVNHLRDHPQWGALVETWAVAEVIKAFTNRGRKPSVWFWRSSDGHEIDLVVDRGTHLFPIEIKATRSPHAHLLHTLVKFREIAREDMTLTIDPGWLVYGGDEHRTVGMDELRPWHAIDALATVCP